MQSSYVTLLWDERPRRFERDKLDTAWLILQDIDQTGKTRMQLISEVSSELSRNGFESHDAKTYAIAVFKYDPDNS